MISSDEIHHLTDELGVPLAHLEKDYVMGWILWAIYTESPIKDYLVLKGGNCLRKAYFPETRFSDDLDFTAVEMPTASQFKIYLEAVETRLATDIGIPFDLDRTRVEEKQTPDPDARAIDGRVYFRGFAGDGSLTMRLKFDVSDYETIVLPPVQRSLIHHYSDSADCSVDLRTYAIEEVLAEKLRSWIQRTRARDLFDAAMIIMHHGESIQKRLILRTFLKKTLFKNIPAAGREELLMDGKFQIIERDWVSTIVCPRNVLILAANAIKLFRDFVEALFAAPALAAAGYASTGRVPPTYVRFASDIREAIIQAGHDCQTVMMGYHGVEREIEPYSFRYKTRKTDGSSHAYFFGFDRSRGACIKSFFTTEIQSVRPTGRPFQPRYAVEF